jgi:electron-transferring-flavoprotein dehydrogenase
VSQEEVMKYDVLIVGAGPAGLAAGIHLKQLAKQHKIECTVCIIEKGAQIGAHILSGAVLETRTLQALLPDSWQQAPLDTLVAEDRFYLLTKHSKIRLPTPQPMQNQGNYIISLGALCQFLATQAESLGCEIYTGFAATHVIYQADGQVIGITTGDMGIDKEERKTPDSC